MQTLLPPGWAAYLSARAELGAIWRRRMGTHYPAMSLIFVSDFLDHPARSSSKPPPCCRWRSERAGG